MVVIGAVLLVVSVVLGFGIALFNSQQTSAQVFAVTLANVSVGGLFVAGVAVGAAATAGLALVLIGSSRKRHRSTERKRQAQSARSEQ